VGGSIVKPPYSFGDGKEEAEPLLGSAGFPVG
jgi:hypothetical protein